MGRSALKQQQTYIWPSAIAVFPNRPNGCQQGTLTSGSWLDNPEINVSLCGEKQIKVNFKLCDCFCSGSCYCFLRFYFRTDLLVTVRVSASVRLALSVFWNCNWSEKCKQALVFVSPCQCSVSCCKKFGLCECLYCVFYLHVSESGCYSPSLDVFTAAALCEVVLFLSWIFPRSLRCIPDTDPTGRLWSGSSVLACAAVSHAHLSSPLISVRLA